MKILILAAALATLAACGDPVAVQPPRPTVDSDRSGPTPEQLAEEQRKQRRRDSLEAMNQGVEAATARDFAGAEPHLRRAIELDPDNAAAHYNLGIVLYATEAYRPAVDAFERALALDRSADYQLALGRALFAAGSYEAAGVALAEAALANPDLHEAHYYLGLIHVELGRREKSIGPLRECTRRSTATAGCFERLAESHYELGELDSAITVATEGLASHDESEAMLLILGKAQLQSGSAKSAEKTLGKLVGIQGDESEARLWWSMALSESGNRSKARAILQKIGDSAGGYDLAFARQLARKKRKPSSKLATAARGEVSVEQLRVDYPRYFDKRVAVRGFVAWKYDCEAEIGKKAARAEPERCFRPHFYLGATPNPWPDRTVWVVEVPRPPRPDEKKALDQETLDNWPAVPKVVPGQQITVTGTWAQKSPRGFARSLGLLVYERLEVVKK